MGEVVAPAGRSVFPRWREAYPAGHAGGGDDAVGGSRTAAALVGPG